MSLKTLPVQPGFITDRVQETYTSELRLVTTPEELKAFTLRWRPLYEMARHQKINKKAKDAKRYRVSQKNAKKLLTGDFDAAVALKCIAAGRLEKGGCSHMTQFSCPGMHILLPLPLLDAIHISQHYGVTTDLALIQANGGLGALDGY